MQKKAQLTAERYRAVPVPVALGPHTRYYYRVVGCNHWRSRWLFPSHTLLYLTLFLMKLSKALLSAILVGVTVQATTSCNKKEDPEPKTTATQSSGNGVKEPINCPACGLG